MHSCVRFFGDVSASNVTQMGVCPPPPHAAFQFFHFHSQCNFFNFTVSIVGVECLFVVFPPPPRLCPMSPCRAWWASAMRGSAGINLGNLISGAVVPALNISISLGWLAGWRCRGWTCDGQQLGKEGGRGRCRVQRQDTF